MTSSPSSRDAELEAAYRDSVYVIRGAGIEIETRIDQASPALAALLVQRGVDRAALITACNPDSRPLPDADNQARQREFRAELAAASIEYLPAIGRAADGRWREPSLLVLGIDRAAALACAGRWGQRAIVYYGADGCGRLMFRKAAGASAPPARETLPQAAVGPHGFELTEPAPAPAAAVPAAEAGAADAGGPATAVPTPSPPVLPATTAPRGARTPSVLVTGGGGFLGLALCRRLIERGWRVRSLSRGTYASLAALGVRQFQGDLASLDAVEAATRDVDAVFHVAALAGAWGEFHAYFDANVRGTRNVLAACRMNGVRTLVYTSTPSVAHRGRIAVCGGSEATARVATHFKAVYPATKAVAERAVLAENGQGLATVALRPRLIWGPGDNHLLPRLAERARAGRLRLVGEGRNAIDTTYIDNAVDAHLAAFDALHGHPDAACAGRAYFISNGEPRAIRDIINALLTAIGAPTVNKHVSFRTAYLLGAACERLWARLPLAGEPPMTRFLAEQLVTPHWYDLSAAARDFGWTPRVSIDEGLARLAASG